MADWLIIVSVHFQEDMWAVGVVAYQPQLRMGKRVGASAYSIYTLYWPQIQIQHLICRWPISYYFSPPPLRVTLPGHSQKNMLDFFYESKQKWASKSSPEECLVSSVGSLGLFGLFTYVIGKSLECKLMTMKGATLNKNEHPKLHCTCNLMGKEKFSILYIVCFKICFISLRLF